MQKKKKKNNKKTVNYETVINLYKTNKTKIRIKIR